MNIGMKRLAVIWFLTIACLSLQAKNDTETHRQYLSGHGCDDMVEWDFYCTGGNNSGKWTRIGVPSCWELQGFGTYQYGMRFYGKPTPEGIADEKGLYKYEFTLPSDWNGREILLVFEAAMTDAKVTINGRKAGNVHQGGFYRFQYNVSDRVFFGQKKNRLEVEVSKESANTQVNMAERRADYWNFGGIIRPVFVVSKPARNIQRVAIDAGMDGRFRADCYLNRVVTGASIEVEILETGVKSGRQPVGSDRARVDFKVRNPKLWTAETPHLYTALFTLRDASGTVLHQERQKFGFRTIEYRLQDGVYINGKKVIFKGVNRHSFRPESGRTLSKAKNIEDVKMIKSMNMNAVRLSHYPADPEFLDACDSLGLYVENELSGWHWAHETVVGSQLVEEMVTRDVNHPSVIFWSNGNEGGFNDELEPYFAKFDPQRRVVLYPWANRNGFETKHYRSYGETQEYMRQKEIFMPTEFLHGLYDGGHGAGLADYWKMMMRNPRCAGGFLWDYADEGVVRTDMGGIIDCQGNFGADGILGPHLEKEGSYYTIKEVWSPVVIRPKTGKAGEKTFVVENHYDFLNLNACRLSYRFERMPEAGGKTVRTVKEGKLSLPDAEPRQTAEITLPDVAADNLLLTVTGPQGEEVFTWSFPQTEEKKLSHETAASVTVQEDGNRFTARAGGTDYVFDRQTGCLEQVMYGGKTFNLSGGPRLLAVKRADRSFDQFYNHDDKDAEKKKTQYTCFADQGTFAGYSVSGDTLTVNYSCGSLQQVKWVFHAGHSATMSYTYDFGGVVDMIGITFDYPEQQMQGKRWVGKGPYRVWQNRLQGPQYGYWETDYNDPVPGESFEYPEFKGYFAQVDWMEIRTSEGRLTLSGLSPEEYVGVCSPRDGRDHILYELPQTGISILQVIPAVRNKVNTTDLNGPSAQPVWVEEPYRGSVRLTFD